MCDFTDNLPQPSTIHWHGLRIPIDMDGVPGYSQDLEPGGTFTYDFVGDAGIYWYHPRDVRRRSDSGCTAPPG